MIQHMAKAELKGVRALSIDNYQISGSLIRWNMFSEDPVEILWWQRRFIAWGYSTEMFWELSEFGETVASLGFGLGCFSARTGLDVDPNTRIRPWYRFGDYEYSPWGVEGEWE